MSREGRHTDEWTSGKAVAIKRAVIAAYGGKCAVEGCDTGDPIEVDHIIGLAAGGSLLDPDNLQPLCRSHHRIKTNAERRNKQGHLLERRTTASRGRGTDFPESRRGEAPMRGKVIVMTESSPPRDDDGNVLPRFVTPRPAIVVGTFGPEFVEWTRDALGVTLRPWQCLVADRLLEFDAAGRLVWDEAVVTCARQVGKSVLLRALALWRIAHPEHFGDGSPQTLLHTANRTKTGREVFIAGANIAAQRLGADVRRTNGQEEVTLPNGGRWCLQAANNSTGIGMSLDGAAVDECWAVPASVVDEAIGPTMVEREDAQLLLVSTAGDSTSDLLQSRRDAALENIHSGTDARLLLIEFSTPENIADDDVEGWKWASPHWHDRRERFLRDQFQKIPREAFARQYLDRWVVAVDGWIDAGVWDTCRKPMPEPDRPPDVVACEVSMVGHQHAVVAAWREPVTGAVIVRQRVLRTVQDVDEMLRELRPVKALVSPYYEGRLSWATSTVARAELITATPVVHDLLQRGLVWHDGDPALTRQMLQARASRTDAGWIVSATRSSGPIHAVRALCWAVSSATRQQAGRPRFVAR